MVDPEREDAPTTPPKAIRPGAPVSGTRAESSDTIVEVDVSTTELSVTEPSGRDPNTLMSLPKPEPPGEAAFGERLRELEDRMEALEIRLKAIEARRDPLASGRATPWWFWLLFLVGLAVTWRVLETFR